MVKYFDPSWHQTPKNRLWRLVWETDEANCFMIIWQPGCGLARHSHGESEAYVTVVDGEMLNSNNGEGFRTFVSGQTIHVPPGAEHELQNGSHSAEATTMHMYHPPLKPSDWEDYVEYDDYGLGPDHPWSRGYNPYAAVFEDGDPDWGA